MATETTLSIHGFGGQPVANRFLRPEGAIDALAVLLPGFGYTLDMPLFFYAENLLLERGWDVLRVEYAYHRLPESEVSPRSKMVERLYADTTAAWRAGLGQRSYERVALIGKSLGTLAMGHLLTAEPVSIPVRSVWLTPLLSIPRLREQIKGRENEPAEKVFKNVQTLKGVPAGRFLAIMEMGFARSLGVTCAHCHAPGKWESEDKTQKQVAREMWTMVGRINGRFGEADWVPVRYLYRSYDQHVLAQLYRLADVALVTPLRDGMNLVAKEFVVSQDPRQPGVLVLDELEGRRRHRAVVEHPYPARSQPAQVQPDGGRPRPAVEREHQRPGAVRLAAPEGVGGEEDSRVGFALLVLERHEPDRRGVVERLPADGHLMPRHDRRLLRLEVGLGRVRRGRRRIGERRPLVPRWLLFLIGSIERGS